MSRERSVQMHGKRSFPMFATMFVALAFLLTAIGFALPFCTADDCDGATETYTGECKIIFDLYGTPTIATYPSGIPDGYTLPTAAELENKKNL